MALMLPRAPTPWEPRWELGLLIQHITLTPRPRPRQACRKEDLPTPRAPTTLHKRTFLCVCPFSWSSVFSRVTVGRWQGQVRVRGCQGGAQPGQCEGRGPPVMAWAWESCLQRMG